MSYVFDTLSGPFCYLLINLQKDGQCPLPTDLLESGSDVVRLNGIIYVKSTLAAPYTSFTTLIAADPNLKSFVVNKNTGECRYYDGTQTGVNDYWKLEQRALGHVRDFSTTIDRPVRDVPEIGSNWPVALRSHKHSISFKISKAFIDKKKLGVLTQGTNVYNQDGFLGNGLILSDDVVRSLHSKYVLLVLYMVASDSDASVVAKTLIMPCAKIEQFTIEGDHDKIITASLSGKCTYAYVYPNDEDTNIFEYEHDFTP